MNDIKVITPIGDFRLHFNSATEVYCDSNSPEARELGCKHFVVCGTEYKVCMHLSKTETGWGLAPQGHLYLERASWPNDKTPPSKSARIQIPAACIAAITKLEQEHPEIFRAAHARWIEQRIGIYSHELEQANAERANLLKRISSHRKQIDTWTNELAELRFSASTSSRSNRS